MANFVTLVDPDPARRAAFLAAAAPHLPLLPGLVTGECASHHAATVWAAGARAPVSAAATEASATVVFGDALMGDAGTRLDAPTLGALWHPADGRPLADAPVLDGFHAAVAYDARRGLRAGADVLGWFPLYWFAEGEVVIVASSPELVRHHPLCRTALDPAALAGILMLNGQLAPPALLAPIRRLPPGHLLCWSPAGGAREIPHYAPPTAWGGEDLPWPAYVERIDAALADAVRRHVGGARRVGLLLSGGLDSRMLAGYLQAQGTAVEALTQGIASDVEMRCAVGVARTLGFAHQALEVSADRITELAELTARWEHLAGGFATLLSWGRHEALGELPERMVAGYGFDHLLHANTITPPESLRTGRLDFDTAFALRNGSGVPPAVLRRLFAPTAGAAVVDDTLADLRRRYAAAAPIDFRRYWAFSLADRVRNHIGAVNWRGAFASWPVLPALDHRLLDAIAALPIAAMSGRRLQRAIVRDRFPRLAALPLDHNSLDDTPLAPTLGWLLRRAARERARRAPVVGPLLRRRRETRYFGRTYAFGQPGWTAARRAAEPHRARLAAVFDPRVLAEVLPPAPARPPAGPGSTPAGGLKLLVGLALWSDGRLPG